MTKRLMMMVMMTMTGPGLQRREDWRRSRHVFCVSGVWCIDSCAYQAYLVSTDCRGQSKFSIFTLYTVQLSLMRFTSFLRFYRATHSAV